MQWWINREGKFQAAVSLKRLWRIVEWRPFDIDAPFLVPIEVETEFKYSKSKPVLLNLIAGPRLKEIFAGV